MSAINISKSIEKLSQCYVGMENKQLLLDSSKINDLEFQISMWRIQTALFNEEITSEKIHNGIKKGRQ